MLEALADVQTPDEVLVRTLARETIQPARSCSGAIEAMRIVMLTGCLGTSKTPSMWFKTRCSRPFRHWRDFDGRSGFRTWLLRIVTNTAYDWGRRRKRRMSGWGRQR